MATHLFLSATLVSPTKIFPYKSISVAHKPVCFATITSHVSDSLPLRRSADYSYKPSFWDYNYLQSLKRDFKVEDYKKRAEKLKEDLNMVFDNFADTDDHLEHFELIDDLQRLGLAYHFDKKIKNLLEHLYISRNNYKGANNDLYDTALKFRLFRQLGYHITQGSFKKTLRKDVKGILSLYEASYLSFAGENLMNEAWHFTTEAQRDWNIEKGETNVSSDVQKTIELPIHWRSPRFEVRRFIAIYEKRVGMNPLLLELSKLDFNSTDELKRGDVLKSIQCYMNETGVSEESARERMTDLMRSAWEKLNKCKLEDSPLPRSFVETMINLLQTAHCMYHYGDVLGVQDSRSINLVSALLFQPISL